MVGPSVADERMSEGASRFFSRPAQLVFWILLAALAGYLLLGPGAERIGVRWWPFLMPAKSTTRWHSITGT